MQAIKSAIASETMKISPFASLFFFPKEGIKVVISQERYMCSIHSSSKHLGTNIIHCTREEYHKYIDNSNKKHSNTDIFWQGQHKK